MQNLITKCFVVVVSVFGMAFLFLAVCGSSLLWGFLPVAGVGRVGVPPCGWGWTSGLSSFPVREACVSVPVGGAASLLPGGQ